MNLKFQIRINNRIITLPYSQSSSMTRWVNVIRLTGTDVGIERQDSSQMQRPFGPIYCTVKMTFDIEIQLFIGITIGAPGWIWPKNKIVGLYYFLVLSLSPENSTL